MTRLATRWCSLSLAALLALSPSAVRSVRAAAAASADEPAASDSPMVKLLKSGRVPEDRQGAVVEMIGKRGTVADLDYIYQHTLDGFPEPVRVKALDALAEAATTRGLKPEKDRQRLVGLLAEPAHQAGGPARAMAIRLAGAWKLEAAAGTLRQVAGSTGAEPAVRDAAIEALAAIGGQAGRAAIEDLAGPRRPVPVRLAAVAALCRMNLDAAAASAVELIPAAVAERADLAPMMAAFLSQRGGGAALAAAIGRHPIPADAARLAYRAASSNSQADPDLVAALGRAAGITTETRLPTPAELASLVAEVNSKGDPARGEAIFRRADLGCMNCHAVAKAGGEIGPDLSAIGQTSPPDYIINSILVPDQSIKEQYHTLIVQTSEGQVFQGILTDKDDRRVVLKDSTGALRTIPVDSIEDQKAGGSLMPKGLANLMTHAEFIDLVRFLSELGRPGPYAIRTTPSIQRWRVLKAVPPDLVKVVPDEDDLRRCVLDAPPDRWAIAYARVSGALPLAEAGAASGSKVLYVQGEIDVTAAGTVLIRPVYPDAIQLWIDEVPAPIGTREFTTSVASGRHPITVRVNTADRSHPELTISIEKPAGSTAEFTVVGGK